MTDGRRLRVVALAGVLAAASPARVIAQATTPTPLPLNLAPRSLTSSVVSNPVCELVDAATNRCAIDLRYFYFSDDGTTSPFLTSVQVSVDGAVRLTVSAFFENTIVFDAKMASGGLAVDCGLANEGGLGSPLGKLHTIAIQPTDGSGASMGSDIANIPCPAGVTTTTAPPTTTTTLPPGDPCPRPGDITKPRLGVGKLSTPPGDDTLTFSGTLTLPASPPIDPLEHGLRFTLENVTSPLVDVVAPPGAYDKTTKTGWQANRSRTQFTYRNPAGLGGVVLLKLRKDTRHDGLLQFSAQGKNGAFAVTPPLRVTVVLDPPVDATGQCGRVVLPAAVPPPACAFDRRHNTYRCR